jgi:hypothetical protein
MNLEGHELAKPWKVIAFHTFCIDDVWQLLIVYYPIHVVGLAQNSSKNMCQNFRKIILSKKLILKIKVFLKIFTKMASIKYYFKEKFGTLVSNLLSAYSILLNVI